ncbi:hypothetical protein J6590_018767 [Homalodisca vitripennis]|nr:hypothetical protein J6590_018767 [Homalodisca vitripennis]
MDSPISLFTTYRMYSLSRHLSRQIWMPVWRDHSSLGNNDQQRVRPQHTIALVRGLEGRQANLDLQAVRTAEAASVGAATPAPVHRSALRWWPVDVVTGTEEVERMERLASSSEGKTGLKGKVKSEFEPCWRSCALLTSAFKYSKALKLVINSRSTHFITFMTRKVRSFLVHSFFLVPMNA